MTDEQMKMILNTLCMQLNENNKREILAKAVSLGMKYQEEKIRQGIDIVFENLKL